MVLLATLGAVALLASSAAAQLTKDCGEGLGKCPESKPCCSQYGQCGIGAYCLGGCDPSWSFKLQSCVAAPQCQSKTYKFTDSKSSPILSNTKYLGDTSKADWVSDGQPLYSNGVVYLTMAPETVGTVLASTRYVWYGKISATMKTSRGRGVVSAFIMMSDVKDEIDYEWVGVDLQTSQTNYYWNGIPDYTHSGNITMAGNTNSEWHTYTIDWTPDSITWSIDGQVGRTKKRSETYNATSGKFEFPQTPSRVQLSLWPGGLATNGKGTIDWAGGLIDWDGDDIQKYGYYFAMIREVTVECYDPPSGASGSGTTSYKWKDGNAVNTSVELSNARTNLKSFLGSGTDLDAELPDAVSSTKTVVSTDSAGKATTIVSTVEPTGSSVGTVPGLDGAGFDSGDLHNEDDGSGSGGSSGGSSTDGSSTPETTEWSQGASSNGDGTSSATRLLAFGEKYVQWGNLLAIILVAGAMVTL
ncbi:Beta-glucanase [Dactylella cylindrospora]|nr:Beta-glucanase [Dactylella cylindrospora]